MNVFVNYFLEANIGLVFFYFIYWLFLRNENQFSLKRSFLLGSLIASMFFPLLSIKNLTSFVPTISHAVPATWLPEIVIYGNGITPSLDSIEPSISWTWIYNLYTGMVLALLVLFLIRIASLITLFKQSRHYTWKRYTIAESDKIKGIFSFFNFIFFNPTHQLDDDDKQEILRHEEVHIQRLHSIDTILIQLIGIAFWFNPIIILYKKSLVQLHEFEADAHSVKDHNVDRYCSLLAKVTLQNNGYVLANHFTNSFTLKRIKMMKTIRRKIKNWKVFAVAATLPLFFFVAACNDQVLSDIKAITNESTMVDETNYNSEVAELVTKLRANNPTTEYFVMELANEDSQKKIKELESQYKGHIKGIVVSEGRSYTIFEKGYLSSDLAELTVNDNEVFTIVEEMASPTIGMTAFYDEISNLLKYPDQARKLGVEGRVFIEFIVNVDGSLSEFKSLKGIGAGCDEEAIRVLKLSRQWKPARQRGKAVRQRIVLPITFMLGKEAGQSPFSVDPPTEGSKQTMKVTGDLKEENGNQYMIGQVFDNEGKPMPGMNIVLEGTTLGTVSDLDGKYRLKLNDSKGRLIFSFVGFESQSISF